MQTVQFQCGHCGKVMAVSTEHLGGKVQCPHCRQVVLAPAAEASPPGPSAAEREPEGAPSSAEHESIFGGGEEEQGDALFAEPPPRVEIPPPESPPSPAPVEQTVAFEEAKSEPAAPLSPPPEAVQEHRPDPFTAGATWPDADAAAQATEAAPEELPEAADAVAARRKTGRSVLVPTLLIFLIPYAIFTTAIIAWLLYSQRSGRYHPYEGMIDPRPEDGGPRQIKHDLEVPAKLRTALKQPLQIGDLQVTPLSVAVTDAGDLVLDVRARNLSDDIAFNPLPDSFLRTVRKGGRGSTLYTFLEPRAGSPSLRVYGGYAEWLRGSPGAEEAFDGILLPGKEMRIRLTTPDRSRKEVAKLLALKQPLLWRLHVRRGLVHLGDAPRSATAVIGVEIAPAAIDIPQDEQTSRADPPAPAARSVAVFPGLSLLAGARKTLPAFPSRV